jgi:hypothetical protein
MHTQQTLHTLHTRAGSAVVVRGTLWSVAALLTRGWTRWMSPVSGGMLMAPPLWVVDCWRQRRCMSTLLHCSCASRRAVALRAGGGLHHTVTTTGIPAAVVRCGHRTCILPLLGIGVVSEVDAVDVP